MIYEMTLKGHFENVTLGQGHDLIAKGYVAYQSIRVVDPKKNILCFHRSSWSLSKVIVENCW